MTREPLATDLERRKQIRIRLRPNLVITPQRAEGRTWYVVKDPIAGSYFRLDEGQYFATGLMDGTHTLTDIQRAYEERFRPERLPSEELEALAAQLLSAGLAQNESPLAGPLLFRHALRHRRATRLSTLLNFLYVKIPFGDPTPLLNRLGSRSFSCSVRPPFCLASCSSRPRRR